MDFPDVESWLFFCRFQSHQPHNLNPLLSHRHLSHADCLHLVLGSYCYVSFSVHNDDEQTQTAARRLAATLMKCIIRHQLLTSL